MQIIIVDDNSVNLLLLTETLKIAGYTAVESFSHPHAALEFAANHAIDVALIDQNMPDLTGLELFERLRASQPQPIIAFLVTALTDKALYEEALQQGFTGVISKPFEVAKVIQTLKQALGEGTA